ncbi:MAG: CDC27 family protein [Planctomycetia bacterium]|nr:CDC27 family protein [Planctomycetia bacterium]
MTWKTEIDRTVHEALRRAFDDRRSDGSRAIALANDFVALAPAREQSHFALGLVEELTHLRTLARDAGGRARRRDGERPEEPQQEGAPAPTDGADAVAAVAAATTEPASNGNDGGRDGGGVDERETGTDTDEGAPAAAPQTLATSPDGPCALWRYLGRLDAASRGGPRARVRELAGDAAMDLALARGAEARMALRAVSRALLFGGEDARVYDLVLRHLQATGDEGSRRDADGLVGDAARHADDLARDGDEAGAGAALARALKFAVDAGLEGRAAAKVQRKVGRSHQLAGRWAEAKQAYQDALTRLSADDRYRSVLQGDLALAALEVRGTLDLLPKEGRGNVEEAEALLAQAEGGGEGESYNAIYTLGVLAYERGDFSRAAERFREADRLMRETRAKARIVHARARFFLGACLLKLGAADEALREAEQCITKDASAAALEASVKEPVFDLLAAALPTARIPGRGGPRAEGEGREGGRRERGRRGRDRGERGDRGDRGEREPREGAGDAPVAAAGEGGDGRPAGDGRPEAAERLDRYASGRGAGRGDRAPEARGDRASGGGERGGAERGGGERGERGGGRGDRGDRRGRGPRHDGSREVHPAPVPVAGAAPASLAGGFLATARRVLDADPHGALKAVDDTFRSRPTFEEWATAYRIRLEALIRLGERGEAMRTFERFRAKIHERNHPERLEELLVDPSSPMAEVLDDAAMKAELVDLYGAMAGRERPFVEAATALASHHADLGTPASLRTAISLLREAVALGGEEARGMWTDVAMRARAAGVEVDGPSLEDVRARFEQRGGAKVVVVGGDDASRAHGPRVEDLGRRAGFEGSLVLGGAKPAAKTLADVEALARGAAAIVLLHSTTPELRDQVKRLAADLSVPVRELPYAGPASLEPELLAELSNL